jgi:hypothetical protein
MDRSSVMANDRKAKNAAFTMVKMAVINLLTVISTTMCKQRKPSTKIGNGHCGTSSSHTTKYRHDEISPYQRYKSEKPMF